MKKILAVLVCLFWTIPLHGDPEARTVLVLPFENRSSRSDLGWISEGLADLLSSRLSGPTRYVLDRDERNAAYQQLGIPPDSIITLASEFKVAETLGVDWAVLGDFNVEGNRLTVRARLLAVHRLKLASYLEAAGELSELADLSARLAWRLLGTQDKDFTVGSEEDFIRRFPAVRLDAFENYIRGILSPDDESRTRFLKEAARLNPSDHRAAFELGRFYFDQKSYADSARWLEKIQPADPQYLEAVFLLAVDQYFLGQYSAAEKAFEKLSKEIPLNEVFNNLGVMKARRGQYADALPDLERAYQGDTSDSDFSFNLGVCSWYLKKYPEAARYLREALSKNDDDPDAHTLLAAVYGRLGDVTGQRRELQWLSEQEGNVTADLGGDFLPQVRLKKNFDGRAFRLLSLAVHNELEKTLAAQTVEQHKNAHVDRGLKFLREGRLGEAQRELEEAINLVSSDSDAHLFLAQVYERLGRHQDAARELETSLGLKKTAVAHLWLARVYLSLDRPEAARTESEAVLQMDPGNREAARLMDQIRMAPASAGRKR
ncbi:MAG TPA: tetratricopeptide repeat protein [Terriglobia bacterium]|jgi:Tfp pilus assembly protein PilF/TolB-like protein|nr:tetratricopeptide repeat protein [Terriglobia bacterium]